MCHDAAALHHENVFHSPQASRGTWTLSVRKFHRRLLTQRSWLSVLSSTYTRKRYTRTCDPSHLAWQPLPKRASFHPPVYGRWPQQPQTRATNGPWSLSITFATTRLLPGNSFWLFEWCLVVWCLRRHAVLWHHQCNRAAKKAVQPRTVNHGVFPNMSWERPSCFISDNMMVLPSIDRLYSDLPDRVSCLFLFFGLLPHSWPSLNLIKH